MEPTNDAKERALRQVAIDRKATQGVRGERGRRCERLWTVLATRARQGRSAFELIYQSIGAYFTGLAVPSLLSQGL